MKVAKNASETQQESQVKNTICTVSIMLKCNQNAFSVVRLFCWVIWLKLIYYKSVTAVSSTLILFCECVIIGVTVISPNSTWLATSHLNTTRHIRCVVRVESCLFQYGGLRRSSNARVYKFSLLRSGFAWISGITFSESEVDISNPAHPVAMPLNTCRASRARHDERVAPCCSTCATRLEASRHVYDDFFYAKVPCIPCISCS